MLLGQPNTIPQLEHHNIDDGDLRKRAKYLQRCKEAVWRRWTKEYLRALRERHNLKHRTKLVTKQTGDVIIVKNGERNRGKWQLGAIVHLLTVKDGFVRGAKLRTGKGFLERAVQLLYSLKLLCNIEKPEQALTFEASEFRPRRSAAAVGRIPIQDQAEEDEFDYLFMDNDTNYSYLLL